MSIAVVAAVSVVGIPSSIARADETTISANNLRTGWDPNEPGLSGLAPTESDFGEQFDVALQGQIYAQPLIVDASGPIPATLVVATETDKVYGLNPTTGDIRWMRDLGSPWPSATVGCGNITNQIGVTSTPVYDSATGAVYVMAKTNGKTSTGEADPQHPDWRLHALNIIDGTDLKGWPVTISGYPDNDPINAFNPKNVAQRPGLLLLDGTIYAGFASYCDAGPFDGYLVGVSATTHSITSMWTTVAGTNNGWGGIWQSGGGLVSDGQGRIFFTTGNGNGDAPSPGPGNDVPARLSESIVRVGINSHEKIVPKDYFSPSNNASLNADDLDLGSGGPLAVPEMIDGKRLLVQVGKDGRMFLLNRDNLGGTAQGPGGTDDVLDVSGPFNGVWGHPAYWGGPGNVAANGGYIYDVENQGPLRAFHLSQAADGEPALTSVATSDQSTNGTFGYTSGSPVITSSGVDSGSAVVWVVYTQTPFGQGGDLRAYDAVPHDGTLDELYSSADDSGITFTDEKFTTPATDGNRVYFGTHDGHVLSFGESSQPAVAASPTDFGSQAVGTTSSAKTVTMTATRDATISSVTASGPFTVTAVTPTTVAAGDTYTVSVQFSPTSAGPGEGDLAVTSEGRTDHVNVFGTGTKTGLTNTPGSLTFDTVPVGATKSFRVDIVNTGTSDQVVQTASLTQTDSSEPLSVPSITGVTIRAGQSLAVPITYAPKTGASESDTGTLTVSGASGTAASVSLSAGSISGAAALSLSPNPLTFHSVPIGTSKTKKFTLRNTGNIPLTFSKAGPPAGDFVTSTPLAEGTTLQPGQAVRQAITYTPTARHHPASTYYFNFSDGTGTTHPAQIEVFKGAGVDAIADYYASLGGASSSLGKPVAAELAVPGGRERTYQHGRIYDSELTGAHALVGPVLKHYLLLGGVTSFAGFPITDVRDTPDHRGHDAKFANHTSIYSRAHVGTFEVNGAIEKRWVALGGVVSRLGYPTSDEFGTSAGKRRSDFQHGHISWNPKNGKTTVGYDK
jgi:hypothetical protein